ncbi:zinc finger protein 540 isoform X2 [Drosophila guanche]|uniref:zinc finger protein 540 isoform X2 n=1 Tax=Drosophila guanche TaxID=7266 RepID=UPI0014714A22|nr:zinc finger protein 540 isoform X2 [Drosophila guanche]
MRHSGKKQIECDICHATTRRTKCDVTGSCIRVHDPMPAAFAAKLFAATAARLCTRGIIPTSVLFRAKYCDETFRSSATRRMHESIAIFAEAANCFNLITCSRQIHNAAARNVFEVSRNGLLGKIETLTGLLLRNDEKLPQLLCQKCEQDLEAAFDFRRVCIEVQQRLELEMDSQSNMESESDLSNLGDEDIEETAFIVQEDANNNMDADKHSCNLCGLQFASRIELRTHLYQLHDVVPAGRNFDCSHCGKSFPIASRLTKHLRCIGAELTHECPKCGAKFHSQVLLDNHTGRHHKPPKERHVCHLCGKSLATRFSLKCHLVRHAGTRPHKCQQCSAAYSTAAELRSHERKHTAVRPYSCRYNCGKDFQYCSARSIHERTHMDESQRPFRCEYCIKSFVTRGDCRSHQIQHTMSREHSCNICRLGFKLRKHFKAHLKSMTHKTLEARDKALKRYALGPLSVVESK